MMNIGEKPVISTHGVVTSLAWGMDGRVNYVLEGKNQLVIGIGCTGGKHRSVTLANEIYKLISRTEYGCKVEHRDIEKDSKRKG